MKPQNPKQKPVDRSSREAAASARRQRRRRRQRAWLDMARLLVIGQKQP